MSTPQSDEVEALARAIDRIVFPEMRAGEPPSRLSAQTLGMISYLDDSFPRMVVAAVRRDRLQRRLARALGLPRPSSDAGLTRLEAELNRRMAALDPRWGPVVGGTALLLLGVLGFAVWRRGAAKPAVAGLR
ncbi:MAG: hypothetical protein M3077_12710 [Candidatus Dormibacteraeota bacterium]|nr:hypothetical protein [Candidatus Dormibacteraeota bacterium]